MKQRRKKTLMFCTKHFFSSLYSTDANGFKKRKKTSEHQKKSDIILFHITANVRRS